MANVRSAVAAMRSGLRRGGRSLRGLGALFGRLARGGLAALHEVRRPLHVAGDALQVELVLLALQRAEEELLARLLHVHLARAGLDAPAAEAAVLDVDHLL